MASPNVQQLKIEISKQISALEQNGFAYLGPVLREAIFGDSLINWNNVGKKFVVYNPESELAKKGAF